MSKPSDLPWQPWLDPDVFVGMYADDPADDLMRRAPDQIRLKREDLERTIIALEFARRCTLEDLSRKPGLFDQGHQTEIAQLLLALHVELVKSFRGGRSSALLPGPHEATSPRTNDPEIWNLRFEALGAAAYLGQFTSVTKAEQFVCKLLKSEGIPASRSSLSEWRQELHKGYPKTVTTRDDTKAANLMQLAEKLAFNEHGDWRILDFDAFLPTELAKRAFPFMAYRQLGPPPNAPLWDGKLPEGWQPLDHAAVSKERAAEAIKDLAKFVLIPIARRVGASR